MNKQTIADRWWGEGRNCKLRTNIYPLIRETVEKNIGGNTEVDRNLPRVGNANGRGSSNVYDKP